MSYISSNRRIAKNTIFLYLRMLITMGVTLYTSRIILQVLGIEDFGIYNIIGGIVVLLSIVSNSMTSATQRFITFELGKGNSQRVSDTFSMSLIAHLLVCVIIIFLGETIGLWYIQEKLLIPDDRHTAAFWVYQVSLLTVLTNVIRSPYNASVIAYEKMSFYAYVSVLEVLLKLGVVLLLVYSGVDKLILYSILIFFTSLFVLSSYIWYCLKQFTTCKFYFVFNQKHFSQLFEYLGWNLLGATASMGTLQAGNLIINRFLGVAVNAAYGVANQINMATYSFVSNFQIAFTPQLIKLFSKGDMDSFNKLANKTALLSYYLLFIIAFPFIIHINDALSIWLVEVPQYTDVFCQLLIIYSLIDALQAPLWIEITASGNIKNYQIWLSAILLLNIPLSIILLYMGFSPIWVLIVRVFLNLVTAGLRCLHVKLQFDFPVSQYINQVLLRSLLVSVVTIIIIYMIPKFFIGGKILSFMTNYIIDILIIATIIALIGINRSEKEVIKLMIKNRIQR